VKWFDNEKELWILILTGSLLSKAFCAGADLKEWLEMQQQGKVMGDNETDGFCGISRRRERKPIIAAVNGFAFGGGFEMVVNWFGLLGRG